MIYSKNLRFACDTCVSGHRARNCLHINRIQDGIVHVIKNRGRPSKYRKDPKDLQKLKLLFANPDPDLNPRCPNTGNFCFECPPRCCSKAQLKNAVYVQDQGMALMAVEEDEAKEETKVESVDQSARNFEEQNENFHQFDETSLSFDFPQNGVQEFNDEQEDDQESIIVDREEQESSDGSDDSSDEDSSSSDEDIDDIAEIQKRAATNRRLQQQRVQQLQNLTSSTTETTPIDTSQRETSHQSQTYTPIQQPISQISQNLSDISTRGSMREIELSSSVSETSTQGSPQDNIFLSVLNTYGLNSDLYNHYKESYRQYENSFPESTPAPTGNYLFGGDATFNEPVGDSISPLELQNCDLSQDIIDLAEHDIDELVASVISSCVNDGGGGSEGDLSKSSDNNTRQNESDTKGLNDWRDATDEAT